MEERINGSMKKNKRVVNNNSKKSSSAIKKYFAFYKESIMRKHIIFYVLSMLIFFIFISMLISNTDIKNSVKSVLEASMENDDFFTNATLTFKSIFTQKIPLCAIVIFAGITPYAHIPVLGVAYSIILAISAYTCFVSTDSSFTLILACIGCIIQMFGISLDIATGVHYCKLSTKKYKYNNGGYKFGLNDIKKQLYETRKDEKKLKEIEKKMEMENKKLEELNVKVPYINYVISFFISVLIVIIGTIISSF